MVADLAIVGAGPAGMAAALAAAAHGLTSVVIDEQPGVGGQIFRRPPRALDGGEAGFGPAYGWGAGLVERFVSEQRIGWLPSTTAWGVFDERGAVEGNGRPGALAVAVEGPDGPAVVEARALLLATGAYDLPIAFPGWTLPGVLTAGGAQAFVKGQRLRPASRVVLAGSHPLLVLVADQLLAAGARIEEVAIARERLSAREALGALPAVPGHAALLREVAAARFRLRRAGVPVRWATIVTGAAGTERVERARLAAVDEEWRVRPGSERELGCDGLVLGYGFVPAIELAGQAGCGLRWDPPAGGWVVRHDEAMRTSVAGVYAAGEPTGVAGAEQAAAEGRLAGLAMARDLGADEPAVAGEIAVAERTLRRARSFTRVVRRLFAPRLEALAALATDDTLVCRCEEVRAGAVRELLASSPHVSSATAVKLESRAGMGLCQGRYCEGAVVQLAAARRGLSAPQVGRFSARMPARPVALEVLAALDRRSSALHPDCTSCEASSA